MKSKSNLFIYSKIKKMNLKIPNVIESQDIISSKNSLTTNDKITTTNQINLGSTRTCTLK